MISEQVIAEIYREHAKADAPAPAAKSLFKVFDWLLSPAGECEIKVVAARRFQRGA
jgi:hypothetical protein